MVFSGECFSQRRVVLERMKPLLAKSIEIEKNDNLSCFENDKPKFTQPKYYFKNFKCYPTQKVVYEPVSIRHLTNFSVYVRKDILRNASN